MVVFLALATLVLCSLWCTQCDSDVFASDVARLIRRVRMSPDRVRLIPRVLRDIQYVLQTRWPDIKLTPYGSIISGVSTEDSDVDISAEAPGFNPDVEEIKGLLDQYPHLFQNIKAVASTVNIVKFYHKPTGHSGDLSFFNHVAITNTAWMKYFINIDKRALDLTMVVRTWAKLHKPEKSRFGRIMKNLGIVSLVVFYLQQVDILPPVAALQKNAEKMILKEYDSGFNEIPYHTSNHASLYELLGGFFQYYDQFDFENMIVSPYTGYPIPKKAFTKTNHGMLPECFELYKINVNNGSKPLHIEEPVIVQDVFVHNYSTASEVTQNMYTEFRADLKFAAAEYVKRRDDFLRVILKYSDIVMLDDLWTQRNIVFNTSNINCDKK